MSEKITKFILPVSIVVAALILGGVLIYLNKSNPTASAQAAAEKAINYINQNKDSLTGGNTASLLSVVDEGGVYKIHLKVGEGEYDSYISKDGKFLFPAGYNLEEAEEGTEETVSPEVQKRDKPDVKLFVMSYCPYGLQAQKMFLPVYQLLKDKTEMGVYFVDYIMHEKIEIDENLRQVCIQKEEKEKYLAYLDCFTKDGEFEKCFSEAGIEKGRIENCVFETDREFEITTLYNDKTSWLNGNYPQFNVHKALNDQYAVQGSPTIVVNDKIVNLNSRSPESFKQLVCQAFNNQPEECSQTLSQEVPSPGLGSGTGSNNSGGCGQ